MKTTRQQTLGAKKNCRGPYHEPLPGFPEFAGVPMEPPTWAFGTASGEIGWLGLMLMSAASAGVSLSFVSEAVFLSGRFNPKG
jgi:hypothetical protein